MKLNFAPDFQNMFRPLTPEELEALEQRILRNEEQRQVTVWVNAPKPNTLIDGHNTFDICKKHNLAPKFIEIKFDSRWEAEQYALLAQLGRRNLSGQELAIAAAKLARALQACSAFETVKQEVSARAVLKKAASTVGVGERSTWNAKKVLDKAAKVVVDGVIEGRFGTTDAAAIADLPKKEQAAAVQKVKSGAAKTLRGAAFDPAALEAKSAKPKPKKSGRPIISKTDRANAHKHLGGLIRALKAMDVYDEFCQSLSAIARRLKQI